MTTQDLADARRLAEQVGDLARRFNTPSHERGVCNGANQALRLLTDEVQALRAQRDVAMHDIRALQAELEGRPSPPFAQYGQCETCGVFSDSAKALHDVRRDCAGH